MHPSQLKVRSDGLILYNKRAGDIIEIVEEEAKWVRQIFAWYLEHIPLLEIRRRLIEAAAPQKDGIVDRRIPWARTSIQSILEGAKEYAFGLKTQSRGGETFTIPAEPIIDMATYEAFLQVRQANKIYPARNLKRDYLIGGLIYCACNRKWGATCESPRRRNRKGEWVDRKVIYGRYFCRQVHKELISADCPRQIGSDKADYDVWQKVCKTINQPEILLAQAHKMVDELRTNANTLDADKERIQKELDALILERQWVITQARKGSITESDMDYQLGIITLQELGLKREFASIGQAENIYSLNDWEAKVKEYLADLQAGIESLNADPQSREDQQEIFEMKRQIVNTLVKKVTIDRNRELHVEISINLLRLFDDETTSGSKGKNNTRGQIKQAGIPPSRRNVS